QARSDRRDVRVHQRAVVRSKVARDWTKQHLRPRGGRRYGREGLCERAVHFCTCFARAALPSLHERNEPGRGLLFFVANPELEGSCGRRPTLPSLSEVNVLAIRDSWS